MTKTEDEYWSVNIPGLTRPEAEALIAVVEKRRYGSFGNGFALDPELWLSRFFDLDTALTLESALQIASGLDRNLGSKIGPLLEDISQWLSARSA